MIAFISDLIKGRMFGHPVHAMLVHFPSALFPMTLVLQAIALFRHDTTFAAAGFYTLAGGLIGGIAALAFGVIDYFKIDTKNPAWKKASLHAICNLTWLTLLAVECGIILKHQSQMSHVAIADFVITLVAVVGMLFSNFHGGELVFHHGIGVRRKEPKPRIGGAGKIRAIRSEWSRLHSVTRFLRNGISLEMLSGCSVCRLLPSAS